MQWSSKTEHLLVIQRWYFFPSSLTSFDEKSIHQISVIDVLPHAHFHSILPLSETKRKKKKKQKKKGKSRKRGCSLLQQWKQQFNCLRTGPTGIWSSVNSTIKKWICCLRGDVPRAPLRLLHETRTAMPLSGLSHCACPRALLALCAGGSAHWWRVEGNTRARTHTHTHTHTHKRYTSL